MLEPYDFEEPLYKSTPLKLGKWGELPIIAIGPKGGKIVGYKSGGKPIYAGSADAKKLNAQRNKKRSKDVSGELVDWLVSIGIPAKESGASIIVSKASAKLLGEAFGLPFKDVASKVMHIPKKSLLTHVGKPLTPSKAKLPSFQAKAASGELENDPFPNLEELTKVKTLKAGQHFVDLYQDSSGKKWTFKFNNETISRAEEAATRIARLLLGPGKAAASKHVLLNGKSGVLLEFLDGDVFNDDHHSNPPTNVLKKHYGEIIQHQIVDWVIGNHDSHAGNYLVTPKGTIGAFDKGQAWKFIGKDKLDTSWKPNNSKQIYLKFWNEVMGSPGGDTLDTIVKRASETLDKVEAITQEQFFSIVSPYIDVRVKKEGINGTKLRNQMWERLQSARTDFQKFLGKQIGIGQLLIPHASEDNFETMPESEPAPSEKKVAGKGLTKQALLEYFAEHPTHTISAADVGYAFEISSQKATSFLHKLYADGVIGRTSTKAGFIYHPLKSALKDPDAIPVIEGGAKAPIVEKPAPGWPVKKGSVTVHHPGEPPSPETKWKKGYPGPGYKAQITYKNQNYTVEFNAIHGAFSATVFFPDGNSQDFSSPNAAADSFVLYDKGLPLDLTATVKKAKGISYPAGKMLKLKEFKDELEQAHTAPSEDLEQLAGGLGLDPEKVKEAQVQHEAVKELMGEPDMTISESEIPAHAYPINSGEVLGAPVGAVVYIDVGQGEYNTSIKKPDGTWDNITPSNFKELVAAHVKEGTKVLLSMPGSAEPEDMTPKAASHPFPPGSNKTVKKKFPWGMSEVVISALESGGYAVALADFTDPNFFTGEFKSLSAASDHVWVKQKGFTDSTDYKAKNNTNKVPSGGGWKFWGIDPKKLVEVAAPDTALMGEMTGTPPGEKIIVPQVTNAAVTMWPVGSKLYINSPGTGIHDIYVKQPGGLWTSEGDPTEYDSIKMAAEINDYLSNGVYIEEASEDNFETMPESTTSGVVISGDDVNYMNVMSASSGATLELDGLVYTKVHHDWYKPTGAKFTTEQVINHAEAAKTVTLKAEHLNGLKWTTTPPVEQDYAKLPAGTMVRWQSSLGQDNQAIKLPTGKWVQQYLDSDNTYVHNGNVSPEDLKAFVAKGDDVKWSGPANFETIPKAPKETQWKTANPADVNVSESPSGLMFTFKWNNVQLYFQKGPFGWMQWQSEDNKWVDYLSGNVKTALETAADNEDVTPNSFHVITVDSEDLTVGELYATPPPAPPADLSELTDLPTPSTPKLPKKKAKQSKSVATNYAKASIVQNIYDVPDGFHKNAMGAAFNQATEWSEVKPGYLHAAGIKSPLWAGWVPPPGVALEGSHNGKTYYMMTSVAGLKGDDPASQVQFTIFSDETPEGGGLKYMSGSKTKSAINSLKSAAAPFGLPTDAKTLKKIFKLDKLIFAPGETFTTVQQGAGPSAFPTLDTSVAPEDMTPAQKDQKVKAVVNALTVFKGFIPDLVLKADAEDLDNMLLVVGPKDVETLEALRKDFGIQNVVYTAATGGVLKVPMGELHKDVSAVIGAELAGLFGATVSDDNWETMPEGYPKVIDKSNYETYVPLAELFAKAPVGTKFVANDVVLEKSPNGAITGHGGAWTSNELAMKLHATLNYPPLSVVPQGVDVSELSATATPLSKPKPKAPVKTKEQLAKEKLFKDVSAWVKTYPGVTDVKITKVLAHLKADLAPDGKLWARMDGTDVIIGAGTLEAEQFATAMQGAFQKYAGKDGFKFEPVTTPLGSFYKIDLTTLLDRYPNATTMEGPDGKSYPQGTTFKSKTVKTSVEDLIKPHITKVSEHKTDASKTVLKLAGTGEDQKTALQNLLEQYSIRNPDEVITGTSYTLVGIPKKELLKIGKTEVLVTPVTPPQPSAWANAPLPVIGGTVEDGSPGVINRPDLATLDAIKLPRAGHWVRCGAIDQFKNNQVCVRKVRDSEGNEHYDVTGQILFPNAVGTSSLTNENFTFPPCQETVYPGYPFPQHHYDEDAGVAIEKSGSAVHHPFAGNGGKTQNGSIINVIKKGSYDLNGTFRVRIPVGADVESELADAFTQMGLDPEQALKEPDAKDERLFIKHQVLRSHMGPAGFHLSKDVVSDEAKLDSFLDTYKVPKKAVTSATIRTSFQGKQVVQIDDLDKAKAKGVRFVYKGFQNRGALLARLLEKAGAWSNRTKLLNGVLGYETSLESDINHGGINATFCRMGNIGADGNGWGNVGGGPNRIVYHPRVLERADWWAYNNDAFGDTGEKTIKRMTAFGHKSSNNEINFETGVSHNDMAGMTVGSVSDKEWIIAELAKRDITEVNGIPVNDFILVHTGSSRSAIAEKLSGLQEGVLQ